ncbi:MAG: DUF2141 domain-containing protein [Pseudomonadota bacterium]
MRQSVLHTLKSFLAGRGLIAALVLLPFVLVQAPASAQNQEQLAYGQNNVLVINLTVDQVRNGEGWITVQLYDDQADNFLSRKGRIKQIRVNAEAGATKVQLEAPGPGTYAIVLYHDENANTDMDTTFIGYPKEGFGFSNNPKLFLAPPSHDQAAFEVAEAGAEVEIKITYP